LKNVIIWFCFIAVWGYIFKNFILTLIKSIKKLKNIFLSILFLIKKLFIRNIYSDPSSRILHFTSDIVTLVRYNIAESVYSKNNTICEHPSLLKYEVNCSGLINHVLDSQYPEALQEIKDYIIRVDDRKGYKNGLPKCLQYYSFFKENTLKKYWEVVDDARKAQAGDVVLFCDNTERVTKFGQHIMLIAGKPKIHEGSRIICSIYDSTGKGHGGNDLRSRDGDNGAGEGVIGLNITGIGAVAQIQWNIADESTGHQNVVIARVKSARPQ